MNLIPKKKAPRTVASIMLGFTTLGRELKEHQDAKRAEAAAHHRDALESAARRDLAQRESEHAEAVRNRLEMITRPT